MVQKVTVSRKFEAELRHATLKKSLFQPSSKWVSLLQTERDKAAKGKRWVPPFISCA